MDQVKRAESGSPSNGEMKFGMTKSISFEVLPGVHADYDLVAQPTQWHRSTLRKPMDCQYSPENGGSEGQNRSAERLYAGRVRDVLPAY